MPQIDVYSNMGGKELNAIGLAIFRMWSEFAIGQRRLGGRRLEHPTGTYQSSLRVEMRGMNHVAVIADTAIAPHAKFIESGHGQFDLLPYLTPGRSYPIQRTTFFGDTGAVTRFNVNPNTGRRGRGRATGLVRAGRFVPSISGIVRTPRSRDALGGRQNTSRRGPAWTVPTMPAYSPARIIAGLFAQKAAAGGGTISYTS